MSAANRIEILQDLKKHLRATVGKELAVLSYKAITLLPPGENYGSSLYKVEVKIKKTKNSPEETLHLVSKMVPATEFQKSTVRVGISFAKEIFVYDRLAAYYRQIEEEAKLGLEETLSDLFPKFYGGQLTRSEEDPEEADENTLLLLENIKLLGYDIMDRKIGLDLDHAMLAIRELARFHALGVALRTHKPASFEESAKYLTENPFELSAEEFKQIMNHSMSGIAQDPRIRDYEHRIRATSEGFETWQSLMHEEVVEPWLSINHGDFWVNNMMFRHDPDGRVKDVKMIDFQIARIGSPIYDLPYFLCTSTSFEVLDQHLDDLCDAYYTRFIQFLERTNCDTSAFTRASFEEQLKRLANRLITHIILAAKFFTLEVTDDVDMSDIKASIMMSSPSKLFLDRIWSIVKTYLRKGWF